MRSRFPLRRSSLALVLALPPVAASAQDALQCPAYDAVSGMPSPDLYCIELLPAANVPAAEGIARLLPARSPFGIAVTAEGGHVWDVAFTLRGLPAPSSLGAYTRYVAWATTPQLAPVVRLGEVRNGVMTHGQVTFDRFFLIVTAEPAADANGWTGPPVLRGTSAAVRMQPHDIAFVLAGMLERDDTAKMHAHHAPSADTTGWTPPPMHPAVAMPPALMQLRPDAAPYQPESADAPFARPRELMRLQDGDSIALTASPVRRRLFGRTVTMLGFNGQVPGPLIEVSEAATVHIRFTNRTDYETAIHWHGIRLDNRFDGVPHVTQEPVAPGESFDYTVHFPDAGLYWYHPHHREDILQDLGLYGNLLVRSRDPDWLGPANREEFLLLDDLLANDGTLVPYGRDTATHALMGRFGNVLLVNGEPRWDLSVADGEVVRLFLTNVSSTRVFNLSFDGGARMKVVASDLGRFEREEWVDNVVIAPAERYIVDVRFDGPGEAVLVNRVHAIDHIMARFFEETDTLGAVRIGAEAARPDHAAAFGRLRENAAVSADIARHREHFDRAPDHTLVVTLEPGELPFPLLPLLRFESVYRHPVEWSGTMPDMDWLATSRQVRWILRDPATGLENMDIDWRFALGDVVRLRLVNDRSALHAMQHPIHIHGQRFLVLSLNGVPNDNLVWKDTVLLPTGSTAELLVEITNPGEWMIHCHISEHIESGMRATFTVR